MNYDEKCTQDFKTGLAKYLAVPTSQRLAAFETRRKAERLKLAPGYYEAFDRNTAARRQQLLDYHAKLRASHQ